MSANAADDHGVTKVEFYLNRSLRATDVSAPYTASLTVHRRRRLDRWHTVWVRAYDEGGHVSSASAQVYVASGVTASAATVRRCTRAMLSAARVAHHRRHRLACARRIRSH